MSIYEKTLKTLEEECRLRKIPEGLGGLDLISNDYMSLGTRHSEFLKEFHDRFENSPMSASASRLLQRHQTEHNAFEEMLEGLYNKKILLLNSGYHANTGALSAMSVPGTLIISDKLIHASMIDGIRLGHGDTARFAHNDMAMLRKILEKKASQYNDIIIAVESVYSMDGALAPLK